MTTIPSGPLILHLLTCSPLTIAQLTREVLAQFEVHSCRDTRLDDTIVELSYLTLC